MFDCHSPVRYGSSVKVIISSAISIICVAQ